MMSSRKSKRNNIVFNSYKDEVDGFYMLIMNYCNVSSFQKLEDGRLIYNVSENAVEMLINSGISFEVLSKD